MKEETTNETTCVDCDKGIWYAQFHPFTLVCDRCKGTGLMATNIVEWIELGEVYRKSRADRRETLRDCAKRLNIDVMDLSHAERGFFNPTTILEPTK